MPARAINHTDEIREVYLLAFDAGMTDPVTVEQETDNRINTRFARELLGLLTTKKILSVEENDEGEFWYVAKPGPHDQVTREEADAFISDWLGIAKTKPAKKTSTPKTPKPDAVVHDCYCGCGEQITSKAFYRPGHDARHAGQVGRKVAAILDGGHDEGDEATIKDLYNELPSEKLVEKATRIAETANEKNLKKANKASGKPETGRIRIGKTYHDAVRYPDGKVVADTFKKPLSKTAIASFEVV